MQMTIYYFPRISEQDYPAFQNIPGLDIPATYEGWLQQQAREKAGDENNGDAVILVDVAPGEFIAYCQVAKTICDLQELEAFAATKASAAARP